MDLESWGYEVRQLFPSAEPARSPRKISKKGLLQMYLKAHRL